VIAVEYPAPGREAVPRRFPRLVPARSRRPARRPGGTPGGTPGRWVNAHPHFRKCTNTRRRSHQHADPDTYQHHLPYP
jgi:hypothetical protein